MGPAADQVAAEEQAADGTLPILPRGMSLGSMPGLVFWVAPAPSFKAANKIFSSRLIPLRRPQPLARLCLENRGDLWFRP